MTIANCFSQFLGDLRLTKLQQQDVDTKRHNVGRVLHAAYYGGDYTGATNFLGGSHGKGLAIRPPSDIDLMFIVPYETYLAFSQRTGNVQSQLLQDVRMCLKPSFPRTDIRADGQVVVVPFESYMVEVVPCIKLKDGKFWICDSNGGGSWRVADPNGEIARLAASDQRSIGNTRSLIKMMKCWRNECNVPFKPFWFELLAQEFLLGWQYYDKGIVYYDWLVRDFLRFLLTKTNTYLYPNGTSEWLALGNAWESRARSASERASKACTDGKDYPYLATAEWQKIFGNDFPNPSALRASTILGLGS